LIIIIIIIIITIITIIIIIIIIFNIITYSRFISPTPSGFRDININIRLMFPVQTKVLDSKGEFLGSESFATVYTSHTCELQIHHREMKQLDAQLGSHSIYEYFRTYFKGCVGTVENRLRLLEAIIGDVASIEDENSTVISIYLFIHL